ncbi:MAG: Rne/Rng family ribonuclease [Bdellovibrionia bacterium]
MANELIINASLPETRIALMEDGEIQELLIERASGKGIVGNIYKGRVTRVLPGMQAAFVDIGLEKAAFLYVDDVYVHSEIWEEEEGVNRAANALAEIQAEEAETTSAEIVNPIKIRPLKMNAEAGEQSSAPVTAAAIESAIIHVTSLPEEEQSEGLQADKEQSPESESTSTSPSDEQEDHGDPEDEKDGDDDEGPAEMGPPPEDGNDDSGNRSDKGNDEQPAGTIAPEAGVPPQTAITFEQKPVNADDSAAETGTGPADAEGDSAEGPARRRHRRGRRGGRIRKKVTEGGEPISAGAPQIQIKNPEKNPENYPENYHDHVAESGDLDSDRSDLTEIKAIQDDVATEEDLAGRPEIAPREGSAERRPAAAADTRSEFKAQRSRDRRIRPKTTSRPVRGQVNIQDLLKEGQEILVQVAKDPIATKGARLTCHISLPGRHLVCMPTIDHVGVSRRIERDDERRRLREYVERNRPRNLGFIVRTASGKQQSEKRIKQDIEYLTRLWTEIKEKAGTVTAPALVYEDLNSILRAIRDWVNEEIDKVIVDSRYHFNEIQRFVSHFMPSLKQKVELYHGDVPIFDAYGISTELSRALERKVWLKSGGYIVVDQAEALVAIDVNTGRYVGKKNLEDTILKTNLEAVQEIAYQLRLRNCGGIIILDLIDMEKDENKQRVYRALEDALSRDRARPTILKISELGLVEMTRKRTRDTIVRSLCESCSHCEGKGFIKSKQTVAYEVMREIEREGIDRDLSKILIQAHPDVIDILAIDERETLDQLERRYRKSIYLQAVNDYHAEQFEVTADKVGKSDRGKDEGRENTNERSGGHDRSRDHNSDRNRNRGGGRDRERNQQNRHEHSASSNANVSGGGEGAIIEPVARPIAQGQGEIVQVRPVISAVTANVSNENRGNGISQISPITPITPVALGSPGNMAVLSVPSVQLGSSNAIGGNTSDTGNTSDGHFDEEDRLAFLRAQAAQDAALARLGSGGNTHSTSPRNGSDPARGDRAGAGTRRPPRPARRGTKFRRGPERERPRPAPRQFGFGHTGSAGTAAQAGPGGPVVSTGPVANWVEPPVTKEPGSTPAPVAPTSAPDTSSSDRSSGGEGSGSSGGNVGGGGDHSQPPV